MDSAWVAFQQEQVTAIVEQVRSAINEVRPGLPLSAAVVADTLTALTVSSTVASHTQSAGRARITCRSSGAAQSAERADSVQTGHGRRKAHAGLPRQNQPGDSATTDFYNAGVPTGIRALCG